MTGTVRAADAPPHELLDRLLVEHDTWLTVERGLAANSLAAYRRDLRRYSEFLSERGERDPSAVREETVLAYVEELKSARDDDGRPQYAPSSIARALVAVRSFHRFCLEEGFLAVDPSDVELSSVHEPLDSVPRKRIGPLLDSPPVQPTRSLRENADDFVDVSLTSLNNLEAADHGAHRRTRNRSRPPLHELYLGPKFVTLIFQIPAIRGRRRPT